MNDDMHVLDYCIITHSFMYFCASGIGMTGNEELPCIEHTH